MEKMQVLGKLRSSISYSAVGPDLNVNNSTVLLNKEFLDRNT